MTKGRKYRKVSQETQETQLWLVRDMEQNKTGWDEKLDKLQRRCKREISCALPVTFCGVFGKLQSKQGGVCKQVSLWRHRVQNPRRFLQKLERISWNCAGRHVGLPALWFPLPLHFTVHHTSGTSINSLSSVLLSQFAGELHRASSAVCTLIKDDHLSCSSSTVPFLNSCACLCPNL